MWRKPCAALAVLISFSSATTAHAGSSLRERATGLGLTCVDTKTVEGPAYVRCDGELPSFDGIGLRITIGLPPEAQGPLPLVSLFHGWLMGGRQEFLSQRLDGSDMGRFAYHWNVAWFATRGYVSAAWTTRGVASSCGLSDSDPKCLTGHLHLAERDFEVRDAQHLMGTLVDAGIADAAGLVATGGSLGGGISWQLATSFPWDTPAAGTRKVKLAAAVPQVAWTDLLGALVPNGRASDEPHGESLTFPFGAAKTSQLGGLVAIGRADPGIPREALFGQLVRYNEANPAELHSHIDGQVALMNAGEPYDASPGTAALIEAYRNKSPMHADAWLAALARGEVEPVPVFAVSGWMDNLFPGVETLQMYTRLRAADRSYPIELAFGGFAHKGDEGRWADWQTINDTANGFVDEVVSGRKSEPRPGVQSFVAQCSPGAPGPFTAKRWTGLARDETTFRGATAHTTRWLDPDAQDIQHDPTIGPHLGDDPICKREARTEAPATATWTWPVADRGFTTAGLPRIGVDYAMTGVDATLVAKLWDVAPDGTRTLADRGVYRLATIAGDPRAGRLNFKLWGTSWNFLPGHRVQLELSQHDGAMFRPDDLPSTLTLRNAELTLPTIRPSTRGHRRASGS